MMTFGTIVRALGAGRFSKSIIASGANNDVRNAVASCHHNLQFKSAPARGRIRRWVSIVGLIFKGSIGRRELADKRADSSAPVCRLVA